LETTSGIMEIRKISVGSDYKNSMNYVVGQRVLDGSQQVYLIKHDMGTQSIMVYVINEKKEVVLWKRFNEAVAMSIEYNVNI
jgi:hypothetical protein